MPTIEVDVDGWGRVPWQGNVIGGLDAAGNAMGSVMGMTYGGHGGTLGPGLVFGYLERSASRPKAVLQELKEHCRDAKDKSMRIVS